MKHKLLLAACALLFSAGCMAQTQANDIDDFTTCSWSGLDLTYYNEFILGSQSPQNFTVGYFETLVDAQTNVNAIVNANNYMPIATTTIYARVTNSADNTFAISSFTIAVENLTIEVVDPITGCDTDGDGIYTFDLSVVIPELLQNSTLGTTVTFYAEPYNVPTQASITNIDQYNSMAPAQVYVRLVTPSGNCSYSGGLSLEVANCDALLGGKVKYVVDSNDCATGKAIPYNDIKYTGNGTEVHTYTKLNGAYRFYDVPQGNAVITVQNDAFLTTTPSPAQYSLTIPAQAGIDKPFCLTGEAQSDLRMTFISDGEAKPGDTSNYKLMVFNNSAVLSSGTVTLTFDAAKLTPVAIGIDPFNPATQPQAANGVLTFSFTNLAAFATKRFEVQFLSAAAPIANVGQQLSFTATVDAGNDDVNPDDNTVVYNTAFYNGLQFNDMYAGQGAELDINDADEYLTYIVRFHNQNEFSVNTAQVAITLDDKFDEDSFQIVNMYFDGYVTRTGNEVNFEFDNMYFAPSFSTAEANPAYIVYRVKPKSTVQSGDVLNAVATISINGAAAEDSNTAVTTITGVMGVAQNTNEQFVLYPNPASSQVTLQVPRTINTPAAVTVTDVLGKTVITGAVAQQHATLNTATLKSGLYFVTLTVDGASTTKKLLIE